MVTTIHSPRSTTRVRPTRGCSLRGVPGSEAKRSRVRVGSGGGNASVGIGCPCFAWADRVLGAGQRRPRRWKMSQRMGYCPCEGVHRLDWVGKLVVSTRRQSGGEFAAQSGNGVGETVAFAAMFVRSRGGEGEAETGGRRVRNLAEGCGETSDAGSGPSRRRVSTAGLGRLAADQKAPRA
jgi:hypothetical protein